MICFILSSHHCAPKREEGRALTHSSHGTWSKEPYSVQWFRSGLSYSDSLRLPFSLWSTSLFLVLDTYLGFPLLTPAPSQSFHMLCDQGCGGVIPAPHALGVLQSTCELTLVHGRTRYIRPASTDAP